MRETEQIVRIVGQFSKIPVPIEQAYRKAVLQPLTIHAEFVE